MNNYINTPKPTDQLPTDKIEALKDIQIELDNIQEYIIDSYNNHVFHEQGIVPFAEVNIEDMTTDELKQIAYDINVLYGKLEQTMSNIYK